MYKLTEEEKEKQAVEEGGARMVLDHVGVVNKDENGAVHFYRDLLGLEVIKESSVSSELGRKLFAVDAAIKMLVYGKDNLKVEVFVLPGFVPPSPAVPHFCVRVPDLCAFLEMAEAKGVKIISAERGGRTVHFVEDFSGNRIEVKQQDNGE
jgi:catechol 2,3-dioxygenase-like lactoylglutathione lyase family enzyme